LLWCSNPEIFWEARVHNKDGENVHDEIFISCAGECALRVILALVYPAWISTVVAIRVVVPTCSHARHTSIVDCGVGRLASLSSPPLPSCFQCHFCCKHANVAGRHSVCRTCACADGWTSLQTSQVLFILARVLQFLLSPTDEAVCA
jgi:hypothetical protein